MLLSKKLMLQLDGAPVEFLVRQVLVAGYTGRDAAQVHAHIAELEKQGIPAPDRVPTLYPLDASWATTDTELVIASRQVSGEVEPALLFRSDRLDDALVSVIVDFTDREEERRSIKRSKKLPKPLSAHVWRYRDAAGIWNEIAMRSWARPGPERELYQSGTLTQLLSPPDLLASLNLTSGLEGAVLLMGTLPLRSKEFAFTDYFGCELETPDHRKLSYECRLRRKSEPRLP
ncbi:MAG: DUF2848 family protein [Acidobacteria bacterium]|nr:DUF2848 family protein [Acidobacteriota bacterium]